MLFVSYVRRSAKILILNKGGIVEKISYERRAYESSRRVGRRKEPILGYVPKNDKKKTFMHLRVNTHRFSLDLLTCCCK